MSTPSQQPTRAATVRLTAGASYCSGSLITRDLDRGRQERTDLVLTCAHFFRGLHPDTTIWVTGAGPRARVAQWLTLLHSDLAVVRLDRPSQPQDTPAVARHRPRLGSGVRTHGWGGNVTEVQIRPGRILGYLPLARSRGGQTRVARPILVFNRPAARAGDSGGPVLAGSRIVGVQSLVLSPGGFNTGVATVGLTAPMRSQIKAAVEQLYR